MLRRMGERLDEEGDFSAHAITGGEFAANIGNSAA